MAKNQTVRLTKNLLTRWLVLSLLRAKNRNRTHLEFLCLATRLSHNNRPNQNWVLVQAILNFKRPPNKTDKSWDTKRKLFSRATTKAELLKLLLKTKIKTDWTDFYNPSTITIIATWICSSSSPVTNLSHKIVASGTKKLKAVLQASTRPHHQTACKTGSRVNSVFLKMKTLFSQN